MRKDLYHVLGLRPDCSFDDIKTAYRKLALKFHPDVNSGDKYFEERFREVQEAYEILSNVQARSKYDLTRGFTREPKTQSPPRTGNNYSTPASLADHVETTYRKIKWHSSGEVDKTQLISFFDYVLRESLVAQLVKIADTSSNERIVEAMVPLFRFLTPTEVNKYAMQLVRLAGSNGGLIIKIHTGVKDQVRTEQFENWSLLGKAVLGIVVVIALFVAVAENDNDTAKSQPDIQPNFRVDVPELIPMTPRLVPPSRFKGNQLKTGDSPYNDYFGHGVYDRSYLNRLEIKNGQDFDAIVCLTDYYRKKTIRNEYIRAGDSFVMTNVPNGTYFLKSFYGKDWNPDSLLLDARLKGCFDTSSSFSKSDDFTDLIKMEQNTDQYSIYTVTLYRIPGGNLDSEAITSSEFFANAL